MYKGHRVAVVMPIHNEENHVARAIERVPHYVDTIIAVDDGSTDGTWAQLSRIPQRRLQRVRHVTNRGVGAATKTGYRRALDLGADLVAVMDGDGQMHGGDLWRLLDRALEGADYVKGNRFLDVKTISSMPSGRRAGNLFLSWLTRVAVKSPAPLDAQCGYTVIRGTALQRLCFDDLYDSYGFPNAMLFAAMAASLKVACVRVRCVYGTEVSGINPFTAIPRILYLIGRGCVMLRFKSRSRRVTPVLQIIPARGTDGRQA
ncbi:MAG TPA: glycosyltransferase family 2 protein [Blastocatellia bacterium]|jgi:glycosyltransferase involved in cell wall biosynthesis|nr:glycosyltransferase family 2 protein [Blastocatellia bacterium]